MLVLVKFLGDFRGLESCVVLTQCSRPVPVIYVALNILRTGS